MIVRIQQFEATDAERFAGWADLGAVGAIRCPWPTDACAFELSVLEQDEQNRPVAQENRRARLRALVAPLADSLRTANEALVVRLDGPVAPGELLGAFTYLTDASGTGRFAISAAEKLDAQPIPAGGGVRIELSADALGALCADMRVGIDRNVRLRVFSIPLVLVNPLLDTADLDDERWPELLPQAGFVLQNTHGLDALHVVARRPTEELSRRLASLLGGDQDHGDSVNGGQPAGGEGGAGGGAVQSSIRSPR